MFGDDEDSRGQEEGEGRGFRSISRGVQMLVCMLHPTATHSCTLRQSRSSPSLEWMLIAICKGFRGLGEGRDDARGGIDDVGSEWCVVVMVHDEDI